MLVQKVVFGELIKLSLSKVDHLRFLNMNWRYIPHRDNVAIVYVQSDIASSKHYYTIIATSLE